MTTETNVATDAPILTARKTVTVNAITPDVFDFASADFALSKFKGGLIQAEFDGNSREAKSEKAAITALVNMIALASPKVADYEVITTDWKLIAKDNAPEYTADKDNAAALTKLSSAIAKAAKALEGAEGKTRESVLSIGHSLSAARDLLAVETDSASGKPAKAAWGRWLASTPYAASMANARAANISEAINASQIDAAIMAVMPSNLISAKAMFNFNNAGHTNVAIYCADFFKLNSSSVTLVTEKGNVSIDMAAAGAWDGVLDALEACTANGVEQAALGEARHAPTADEAKDGEQGKLDAKQEKVRQSEIASGVFATVIAAELNDMADDAFNKSKFGKMLVKAMDTLLNAKTDEEKATEKTDAASEHMASAFENLTFDNAVEHLASICANRTDAVELFAAASEYWESEFATE